MLLITRPNHDNATNYLFYWSSLIKDYAIKEKLIKVLDLDGEKANRKFFWSYLKKQHPNFYFINGHGSDNCVTGFDNEVLLNNLDKMSDFVDSILVVRSCCCANVLGKLLIDNGAAVFIGYINNYVVKTSKKFTTNPLKDKLAALFLEPSNLIVKVLLKGKNAGEADCRSKKMLLDNLKEILSSNSSDKEDTAKWLYHDYCSQVLIGNKEAVVV